MNGVSITVLNTLSVGNRVDLIIVWIVGMSHERGMRGCLLYRLFDAKPNSEHSKTIFPTLRDADSRTKYCSEVSNTT